MALDANLRVLEGDPACAASRRSAPATHALLAQGDLRAPSGVLSGEVAAIERALFEDAASTRDGGPPRQPVGGTAEMLHRHSAAIMFGKRGGGKSTVALILAVSAAVHGERAGDRRRRAPRAPGVGLASLRRRGALLCLSRQHGRSPGCWLPTRPLPL